MPIKNKANTNGSIFNSVAGKQMVSELMSSLYMPEQEPLAINDKEPFD